MHRGAGHAAELRVSGRRHRAQAWCPRRSAARSHRAGLRHEERIRLADLPKLLAVRTNLLILLQALPGTVPWGVFFVYLNDYYAHDKGFSVQDATLLVMVIGAAALAGGFVGGLWDKTAQ